MQLPDGPAHKADRDYNQRGYELTLKLVQNIITALFGLGLGHLSYWYCWLVWPVTDAVT